VQLRALLQILQADPAFAALPKHDAEQLRIVAPTALQPLITAAVADGRPVLAVTATNREAEDLVAAARSLDRGLYLRTSGPGGRRDVAQVLAAVGGDPAGSRVIAESGEAARRSRPTPRSRSSPC